MSPQNLIVCDNNENNFHNYVDSSLKPMIDKEVFIHFLELREEAKKYNFDIIVDSGYRSYEYQFLVWYKIFNDKYFEIKEKKPYVDENRIIEEATLLTNKTVASPGHSEHQTGLAFDIAFFKDGIYTEEVENTKESEWMANNAHKFGFILRYPKGKENITGYNYEQWHFRYIGLPHSIECYEKNLTLEEYLQLIKKK